MLNNLDYEKCKYFLKEEIDYDITNGHSDYKEYCFYRQKEIISFIHCRKCIEKGEDYEQRD